jgi:integrase
MTTLWDDFDLAERLGLRPSWVAERGRKGLIPCIKLGRYRRYDPASEDFKAWLESQTVKVYSAAQSEKDGPLEDQNMARTSYQRGRIEQREGKQGLKWVLRYRMRSGSAWIEKTEELPISGKATEKAARKAADTRMVEINQRNSRQCPKTMTVSEYADSLWKKYLERIKPSTAYSYQSMLKTYVLTSWGYRLIDSMLPEDITLFLEARESEGLSDKYRVNLYGLLNVFFEVAEEYNLIESNPVRRKLHRPKVVRSEKVALTAEEIKKTIACASQEDRALLLCIALTGLRVGELLALRWMNIDFDNNRLVVTHNLWRGRLVSPKTEGSKRRLHLSKLLAQILQMHRHRSLWDNPEDYVFCNGEGKPLDPDNLRHRVLYPALETAGITKGNRTHGFHLFRHSAATILNEQTRGLRAASELLGHSQESTTAGYTHKDRVAEEATEILAREIGSDCGLTVAGSWVEQLQ